MTILSIQDTMQSDTKLFLEEVLAGLQKPQKELPSKYFYDSRGSMLFDAITELEEYYVTRTERRLLEQIAPEMASLFDINSLLIEYGSGSSSKTRILLDALPQLGGYIPIDISGEYLLEIAEQLHAEYPKLNVYPVAADYTQEFALPSLATQNTQRVAFFLGSTIGNFAPRAAQTVLENMAKLCGKHGRLIIGIDLKKDPKVLHQAYNDREGLTSKFNLNILHRINNELGANFVPDNFDHYAFYNAAQNRVEMHLISQTYQTVEIDNTKISFRKGESIWTESSYKYNVDEFANLAALAGLSTDLVWYSQREWFAILACSVL